MFLCTLSNLPKFALGGTLPSREIYYGFLAEISKRRFFYEVYVEVWIRTKNLEVPAEIRIEFWKKVRITKIEIKNTPFRWLSGVLVVLRPSIFTQFIWWRPFGSLPYIVNQPYMVILSNILTSQVDHKRYPPVLNSGRYIEVLHPTPHITNSHRSNL